MAGIIGNTVQYAFGPRRPFAVGHQRGQINDPRDIPPHGINHDQHVGVPDVGVDPALDPFQLVDLGNRLTVIRYGDAPGLLQSFRVQEAQIRRAITHDEPLTVLRDRPSFALVGKAPLHLQGIQIVDKPNLVLPRETDQVALPVHDAFAEILRSDIHFLDDLACFQLYLTDGRLTFEASALV